VKEQSDYIFFYEKGLLDTAAPVTINVKDADIRDVIDICIKGQSLTYIISGNTIGIKRKTKIPEISPPLSYQIIPPGEDSIIRGRVTDTAGLPKEGVTIANTPKGTHKKIFTISTAKGTFEIKGQKGDRLTCTAIGYKKTEVKYYGEASMKITMEQESVVLNGVVVNNMDFSRKKIPFTDTIDMTHRSHLNLGQLLQGTIPGLTLQNSSQSQQTLTSISNPTGNGVLMANSTTSMSIQDLQAFYNQNASYFASAGYPTFNDYLNYEKSNFQSNYTTTVANNGLVPQLRGVSGFNGNTSGMLIVIDGFPQDGFIGFSQVCLVISGKIGCFAS